MSELPDLPGMFFDKDGTPLTTMEWAKKYEDFEYREGKITRRGDFWVTTVWIGFDQGLGNNDEPLTWSSGLFQKVEDSDEGDLLKERYAPNKTKALEHHEVLSKVAERLDRYK